MKAPHFDALIVGAGLSGIGLACHLQGRCPGKSYVILDGRETMGGTWDLFRYPGVRSDSDMYTLSYNFKPWNGAKDIADGDSILQYIKKTAAEHNIEQHVRYDHLVRKATWSTEDAAWTVEAILKTTGEQVTFTCNMLLMCTGYYSYKSGHTPDFAGRERFRGRIVHPQNWPADLSYAGKKVIVIGSGATAVTLVPAMADEAEHVVMLQRSPTYMVSRPEIAPFARLLRKVLPAKIAHALTRWFNIRLGQMFYRRSRSKPKETRELLLNGVRHQLGPDYDIEKHFSPSYDPWDQRVCVVPNGDLFESIKSGKVSMVTEHIDCLTANGVLLKSGEELNADLIITATGLTMEVLGGIELVVDGRVVDLSQSYTYLGMMNSDVPNLVTTFGYINASWTLRADLIADFICRLINLMDKKGVRQCTPRLDEEHREMTSRPFIDNFTSNYIRRGLHLMPKQGDRAPWINTQNYKQELNLIGRCNLEDGSLILDNPVMDQ